MKRRAFIVFIANAATASFASAVPLYAQQAGKVPRIGFLATGSLQSPEALRLFEAFRQGLGDFGYVEGRNIAVEYRGADGNFDRLPALARELVGLKVDIIVAPSTPAAHAVQQATSAIPIVAPIMQDPVGDGFVASLARPGGNVTGLTSLGAELIPKRLGLLKEALPNPSHVAVLWDPGAFGESTTAEILRQTETAAQTLGLQLQFLSVRGPDEFEGAFSALVGGRTEALLVSPGPMFFSERRRVVDLTARYKLPAMFVAKENVEIGGLISYGASVEDLFRRSAAFVDKILKGSKPGDLPVEQPTKFELAINLQTAKSLGLTIPQSLLLRADEVIE